MLILTRSQNESIIIADEIKITVLSDKRGEVKLGIEAPREIKILREEIYESISEQSIGQ